MVDRTEPKATKLPLAAARPALALAPLVILADVLFFGQRIGLSLALFAGILGFAIAALTRHRNRASFAVLALAILPVVEDLNPLSAMMLLLGVSAFALRAHHGLGLSWQHMPFTVLAFLTTAIPRAAVDTPQALRHVRSALPDHPRHLRRNWAMPLGLGICFAILLTLSNPLLQAQAERLITIDLRPGEAGRHVLFCLAMAAAIWPFLATQSQIPATPEIAFNPTRFGINAASVSRGLILFNALFAVQTALDLTYLWAGQALPDGISFATYAHRGAYPLLVTALLAGAFAMVSRPFAHGRLRALLLIWVAQNVLLVISALFRLDLYVQAFGLTYLRIAAAIWMGLVAVGLALTAWQILRQHNNGWLLWRCAVLGLGTLYLCAFVNFAHVIATVNLQRPTHDRGYLCNLGPNATAAIRAYEQQHAPICWLGDPAPEGWRDWGFRTARVVRFLGAMP